VPDYEVRLERAAADGFGELDGGCRKQVRKRLDRLQTSPELGTPLGNRAGINLTGCRKIVLCNRGVRIIYTVEGMLVRVIVIGKREDMEVYRLAQAQLRELG
jgi:mRNA interferase RelE/StbE